MRRKMKKQQIVTGLIVVLLVCGFAPSAFGEAEGAGTREIAATSPRSHNPSRFPVAGYRSNHCVHRLV
jgi:hypothetical protein